jgi:hypothetical protein
VQLPSWLTRVWLRWDQSTLAKRGVWGETEETIEFWLDYLTSDVLNRLTVPQLKHTTTRTRTPNVDVLVQILQRAHYVMEGKDDVVPEPIQSLSDFDRTLDDYLTTELDVAVRAEDAVARLKQDLLPIMEMFRLMQSEDHPRLGYYRRRYGWLYAEVREVLQALARAGDPKISF